MVSDPLPLLLPRWDCIWICNGSKSIICMCLRLSRLSKCAGVPPEKQREISRDRESVGRAKANIYLVSVWGDTVFIDIMHINWIICTPQLDWLVSARASRIYFHLTQVQIQCAGTVRHRQTARETDSMAGRQLHSLMCILIWDEAIGIIFPELVLRSSCYSHAYSGNGQWADLYAEGGARLRHTGLLGTQCHWQAIGALSIPGGASRWVPFPQFNFN